MDIDVVKIQKPEGMNFILGQSQLYQNS